MKLSVYLVGFLSLSASIADARFGDAVASENAAEKRTDISPTLVPESDKKFFGKDYPYDKRPSADGLHFKHPYPVVQDSGDYDADYVKDENSDNGEYMAQTEYDRLRHKLAKEKEQVSKSLAARERAEKELEEAMKRDEEVHKRRAAADDAKRQAQERKKQLGSGPAETESVEPAPTGPGGASMDGEVQVATDDTEKAMTELEKCKKELEETRKKLKEVMDELDEARKKEKGAEDALDAADEKSRLAAKSHSGAEKFAQDEYKEYMDAKEAYAKQNAIIAQMTADIEKAAAKVRGFRDKEDADGGVYPVPSKSSAHKSAILPSMGMVSIISGSLASLLL